MVINVPISIDETAFGSKLAEDVERKVIDMFMNNTRKSLTTYHITAIINDLVEDKIAKEWKEEIIEKTSDKLASRLSRTKAAKELISKEE